MEWLAKHGNILDEPADVLICSANVFLNLSGGVGGAILHRYGIEMQNDLHSYLAKAKRNFCNPGEVIVTGPGGTRFQHVIHAIAIDAFYETNETQLATTVENALRIAASLDARVVALAALATGYGRMPIEKFANAIRSFMTREFPPLQRIVTCLQNSDDYQTLSAHFHET